MRSISQLLRTYNFVNTPEGRRNTVRFFAGLLALAAAGFMVFFLAFGGMDQTDTRYRQGEDDKDPFRVSAEQLSPTAWYIGYPEALYDPDHRDGYDEEALKQRLANWESDMPFNYYTVEVRSDDEHGVLLGYLVHMSVW